MGAIREAVTNNPLYWPEGWKRTERTQRSRFGNCTVASECREVLNELGRMNVPDYNVIISTNLRTRLDGLPYSNQPRIDDPGVAVWFSLNGEERVLACDRWDTIAGNLRAIAKHIGALRGQDRWGVGSLEQAFRGYAALPAGDEPRDWRAFLGFGPEEIVYPTLINERFKKLAMDRHPDHGGTDESFAELAMARKHALAVS